MLGVEIFFVLSGFLITTLLLRELETTQRVNLWAFYVRRARRILPAYFVYLGFVAVLQHYGRTDPSPKDWIAALTYTTNFIYPRNWELGHLWSLSIEEHFYLLWPAVVATGYARPAALACVTGCFAIRCLILAFWPAISGPANDWTVTRIDVIMIGSLLALLARSETWRSRLDRWAKIPVALAVLVVSLALSVSGKWSFGPAYTVNAVCIAVVLWSIATHGYLERHRGLSAVGVGSYSLYLWQQPFLRPGSEWGGFPMNVVWGCLCAVVSYFVVERTFRKR